MWHFGYIYINWIDRQSTCNWHLGTCKLPSFTKTPAITTSYSDL
jgi:hypothetical protein